MPTQTPPHTKVTQRKPLPNGDVQIDKWSMYKDLSSESQEIEQKVETSDETLALDLIKASEMVKNRETPELTLKISTDKATGEPKLITKTFTVNKEYYGK